MASLAAPKFKTPKFKKGDTVVCVEGTNAHEPDHPGGAGWKKDAVYTVLYIDEYTNQPHIYWFKESENKGVYEDWLKLIPIQDNFDKLRKEVEHDLGV